MVILFGRMAASIPAIMPLPNAGTRRRGRRLRLAERDAGRGIAHEHRELIFDECYQVDNSQRDVARGLGIGLAIVKQRAPLVGGEIGLRSAPGRDSVFWIELPRDAPLPVGGAEGLHRRRRPRWRPPCCARPA